MQPARPLQPQNTVISLSTWSLFGLSVFTRARACVCDKIRIRTPTHNHNITQGVLVQATEVDLLTETTMSLTITEGKYHQVKRMIAAIGNRCVALLPLNRG